MGAVILAAGASIRLGRAKQLVELEGQSMVARAVRGALQAQAESVMVVLGACAEQVRSACAPVLNGDTTIPTRLLFVTNPQWTEGMSSSICVGVAALRAAAPALDAVLIAVCDQPAFGAPVVRRLAEAVATPGIQIATARYAGRNGTPAIFRRSYFDRLTHLTGDRGAQALLTEDPSVVAPVDLPELAFDIDVPADLERANQPMKAARISAG